MGKNAKKLTLKLS